MTGSGSVRPTGEQPDRTGEPVTLWHTTLEESAGPTAALVVLLHGRGSDESDIIRLADHLPTGPAYVALRAPIVEGGGFAWFANRGIGRPLPDSLAAATTWFSAWLDAVTEQDRPVVLVGFSGGATFAGGAVLADPARYAGLASLYATLPFDAGVPTTPGRLAGLPVLLAQGAADQVIPVELQARTLDYLQHRSGASLVSRRGPGGHQLTPGDVDALGSWISGLA